MNEGHLRDYMQRVECDECPGCLCFDKELEVRKINGVKKNKTSFLASLGYTVKRCLKE